MNTHQNAQHDIRSGIRTATQGLGPKAVAEYAYHFTTLTPIWDRETRTYAVPSFTPGSDEVYWVQLVSGEGYDWLACTCPDAEYRRRECKHGWLVYFCEMLGFDREKVA